MKLIELFEDVQSDSEISNYAADTTSYIVRKLSAIDSSDLRNNENWVHYDINGHSYPTYFVPNLKLQNNLQIGLITNDMPYGGLYIPSDNIILLSILDSNAKTYDDMVDTIHKTIVSRKFAGTLHHELIHSVQKLRGIPMNKGSIATSLEDYYNDSNETDAYFHEISRIFFKILKALKSDKVSGLEQVKRIGITDNFLQSLNNLLNTKGVADEHIEEFFDMVNKKRFRRTINRLYGVHQEILKQSK